MKKKNDDVYANLNMENCITFLHSHLFSNWTEDDPLDLNPVKNFKTRAWLGGLVYVSSMEPHYRPP